MANKKLKEATLEEINNGATAAPVQASSAEVSNAQPAAQAAAPVETANNPEATPEVAPEVAPEDAPMDDKVDLTVSIDKNTFSQAVKTAMETGDTEVASMEPDATITSEEVPAEDNLVDSTPEETPVQESLKGSLKLHEEKNIDNNTVDPIEDADTDFEDSEDEEVEAFEDIFSNEDFDNSKMDELDDEIDDNGEFLNILSNLLDDARNNEDNSEQKEVKLATDTMRAAADFIDNMSEEKTEENCEDGECEKYEDENEESEEMQESIVYPKGSAPLTEEMTSDNNEEVLTESKMKEGKLSQKLRQAAYEALGGDEALTREVLKYKHNPDRYKHNPLKGAIEKLLVVRGLKNEDGEWLIDDEGYRINDDEYFDDEYFDDDFDAYEDEDYEEDDYYNDYDESMKNSSKKDNESSSKFSEALNKSIHVINYEGTGLKKDDSWINNRAEVKMREKFSFKEMMEHNFLG